MSGIEWIGIYLLLGVLVGFLAGLLGVGGGMLVPVLTVVYLAQGVNETMVVHLALGSSMACMIFTTLSSFRAHHAKGAVLWNVVRSMAPGIIAGTFLATFIAAYLESLILSIVYVCIMLFVSIQMLVNKNPKPTRTLAGVAGLFSIGIGTGAISSLVAMGGGFITVAYLTWCQVDFKKAIGTSSAVAFPIALTGTLGYIVNGWSSTDICDYRLGFIDFPAVVTISVASYLMAPVGARLAHELPAKVLKICFVALTMGLSVKMLVSLL